MGERCAIEVCDGGITVDLAGLSVVEVDPERRIARVGGGATRAAFDAARCGRTRLRMPPTPAGCQDSWTAIEPYAHGAYVNFLAAEDTARTRSAYDPESWARLVRVKQQWDPENLFRVNHNIPPTG